VDVISAMQSLGGQISDSVSPSGTSQRSSDSRRRSIALPPDHECPPGFIPVAFALDGTPPDGGTATVVGCYANGQKSEFDVALVDFAFPPDGKVRASGDLKVTVLLTSDGGATPLQTGTIELKGTLTFKDAGSHSLDIILGIEKDQLVGTKASLDGNPLVDLFPLRVENHAQCDDDKVFVMVLGTDAAKKSEVSSSATHYYYLANPGETWMTIFPPDTKNADGSYTKAPEKSFALTQMTKIADHVYQVNVPTENSSGEKALISGKIFVSINDKLQGIGANQADGTDVTLPSATSVDRKTMFEQMEMTADLQGNDTFYTLFVNATTIDFMCFGPALKVNTSDPANPFHIIGFSGGSTTPPDGTYCVRKDFIEAMGKGPAAFQNYTTQGGIGVYGTQPGDPDSVIRVLGPPQVIPLKQADDKTPVNPALNTYLDDFLSQNWATFTSQINPGFSYPRPPPNEDFTWSSLSGIQGLINLTCTDAKGTNSGSGDTYHLGIPSTEVVFRCDDAEKSHQELGPDYQFYANTGSDAHKRLASIICAGFNRGVLFNNREGPFYQDGTKFNNFARVVHDLAYQHIMYAFGYDDIYGQDGTQAGPIGLTATNGIPVSGKPKITLVTIIIPDFKPVSDSVPILTFAPSSGVAGSTVTLTAPGALPDGFKGATNVLFGAIGVTFEIAPDNKTITFKVPGGAKVGDLVSISVAVPGFPGGTIDSGAARFTVTQPSFTFTPTTAGAGDTLTVTTGQLDLAATTVLFPDTTGKTGSVGAPLTGSNGNYTTKVPGAPGSGVDVVGDGELLIDLVGGTRAQSEQPFTLKKQ
jgi:hypothetical protein